MFPPATERPEITDASQNQPPPTTQPTLDTNPASPPTYVTSQDSAQTTPSSVAANTAVRFYTLVGMSDCKHAPIVAVHRKTITVDRRTVCIRCMPRRSSGSDRVAGICRCSPIDATAQHVLQIVARSGLQTIRSTSQYNAVQRSQVAVLSASHSRPDCRRH